MTPYPFTLADLEALSLWDTTTICNGLELIVPERRALGFTVEPMAVLHPDAAPIVGLDRTGMIRAKEPPREPVADRLDWYDYGCDLRGVTPTGERCCVFEYLTR